jgi:hypothetical protein
LSQSAHSLFSSTDRSVGQNLPSTVAFGKPADIYGSDIYPSNGTTKCSPTPVGTLSLFMNSQWNAVGETLDQYRHDEWERACDSLIGTVQGTGEVATNLAKLADFAAVCIIADNARAERIGAEFGDELGKAVGLPKC